MADSFGPLDSAPWLSTGEATSRRCLCAGGRASGRSERVGGAYPCPHTSYSMLSALSPHAMVVRKYALQGVVRDLGRGRLVPCMGTKRVVYRERAGGAGEREAWGAECTEGVGVVDAVERAGVGGGGGEC